MSITTEDDLDAQAWDGAIIDLRRRAAARDGRRVATALRANADALARAEPSLSADPSTRPALGNELSAHDLGCAVDAIEVDEDTLDALAIERVVQVMRREAASREGRSVSGLLMRAGRLLEQRQAR